MPDKEKELVACLSMMEMISGIVSDPAEVTNFYIALKSKPLVLIVGPRDAGKITLVERLSSILNLGNGSDRAGNHNFQILLGHPWWVGKSQNLTVFTDAHQRFNTDKLLFMLNEARRSENSERLFIICLARISPAELKNIFSETAQQINFGKLNHIGDLHLDEPVAFPSNIRLVGTMDTSSFQWWDESLLSQGFIIQWNVNQPFNKRAEMMSPPSSDDIFLKSIVGDRNEVYPKIHSVLRNINQPLQPMLMIEDLLLHYEIKNLQSLFDDVLLYLANSWSTGGEGLFSSSTANNLDISLDFSISQIVLPRINNKLRNIASLRKKILEILFPRYPRSARFVNSISDADFATGQIRYKYT
jgi:hypothetical protein